MGRLFSKQTGLPTAHALRNIATLLASDSLPGLWLVLTDYEREKIPLPAARTSSPAVMTPDCVSVALALLPGNADGPALEISPAGTPPKKGSASATAFDVLALARALSGPRIASTPVWRLPGTGWLRLQGDDRDD